MYTKFCAEDLKGRYHLGDVVGGRIILKCIFKNSVSGYAEDSSGSG
jgi:hypothetical protein